MSDEKPTIDLDLAPLRVHFSVRVEDEKGRMFFVRNGSATLKEHTMEEIKNTEYQVFGYNLEVDMGKTPQLVRELERRRLAAKVEPSDILRLRARAEEIERTEKVAAQIAENLAESKPGGPSDESPKEESDIPA